MKTAATDDVRAMFDSKYFGAWDLQGVGDVTLTISRVSGEELQNEGGKKRKPVVYFEGEEKALALNKTMSRTIVGLYGNKTRAWVGKQITLYATTTRFGRDTVDCVRVRPTVPQGPSGRVGSKPVDSEMREKQERAARKAEHPAAPLGEATSADELLAAIKACASWIQEKRAVRWAKVLERCAELDVAAADAELALELGAP
jgi:hypothetical protein